LHQRQLGDFVGFHRIHANAGQASVDLVIDEHVFAVVGAILVRGVYVVRVARVVLQAAIGFGADDFLRLVGDAPAHQTIHVENRNAFEQAAGWQTVDPALA